MVEPKDRDRPSSHGRLLGEALALIADKGREKSSSDLPDTCLTCAFRKGCMTNLMASTGKLALDCVLGIDRDDFACHHGMKEGLPTKLCVGYVAAKLAPWNFTKEVVMSLSHALNVLNTSCDPVREAFDEWLLTVDPDFKMDAYQLARAYAADHQSAKVGDQ